MGTPQEKPRSKEWLEDWDPQDESKWDSKIAWTTLTITTFSLTMAFASWFLPSAVIPKLTSVGFTFTKDELYWMTSMVGLSAGILRLVWMVLPPILGTRKLVTVTSVLMILPLVGWGFAVQNPETPYWLFMALAFLAGIGGGAFSGYMPSTSYFFPKRLQGTALGLQAGIGNFGVSLVQLLTPWLIGFSMVSWLGAAQHGPKGDVWYQNAAFVWVPLLVAIAVWAWLALKSVPIKANIRQQFDIFSNPDTWWMTYLYIMTFGTFSGLSALFGLLMTNLYGSGAGLESLVAQGYVLKDPAAYAFLGPLVGAGARVAFSPLTDKMGGRHLDADLRDRTGDLHSGDDPLADPRQELGGSARGQLQPIPVGHAGDLPVLRDRERLDVQADAHDLRAAAGRWRDRMDRRHRGLRTLPVQRQRQHHGGGHLLLDRHGLRYRRRDHHLAALRPQGSSETQLT